MAAPSAGASSRLDGMPEEYKFRCSACHELWSECHVDCLECGRVIALDEPSTYVYANLDYRCLDCVHDGRTPTSNAKLDSR